MNREHIDELAEQQAERRRNLYHGLRTDKTHFEVSKHPFEIVYDYRQGFDLDKFVERYSSILNKYDYIVGDWGFEQLRLKGFFRDDMKDVQRSQTIGAVQDYLYEYCNFGCAYFIIKNERGIKPKRTNRSRKEDRRGKEKTKNRATRARGERNKKRSKQRREAYSFSKTTKQSSGKRHFTIRQK